MPNEREADEVDEYLVGAPKTFRYTRMYSDHRLPDHVLLKSD